MPASSRGERRLNFHAIARPQPPLQAATFRRRFRMYRPLGMPEPALQHGTRWIATCAASAIVGGGDAMQVSQVTVRCLQQGITDTFGRIIPNSTTAATAHSLVYLAICWLPTWILCRKRIFLKV